MADVFTQTGEELFTDDVESVRTWYIAWGEGSTGAVKGDTALETAASESRVGATMSQPSADKNQWLALITSTGTKTITECGIFNAATTGIMIERSTFSGIAVTNGDKIEFTIIGTHS